MWPAISFLLVSVAYGCGAVEIMGKRENGSRSWGSGALLLPYLVLARIVWELRTRISREAAWDAVDDSLIVSRRLRADELPENVAVLVDLTSEFIDPGAIRSMAGYRCIPILDSNVLSPEKLMAALRSIPRPLAGRVVVHCAYGHGRAVLFAAAWMIFHGLAATPSEAVAMLQARRSGISLRRCQRETLEEATAIISGFQRVGKDPTTNASTST